MWGFESGVECMRACDVWCWTLNAVGCVLSGCGLWVRRSVGCVGFSLHFVIRHLRDFQTLCPIAVEVKRESLSFVVSSSVVFHQSEMHSVMNICATAFLENHLSMHFSEEFRCSNSIIEKVFQ